MLISSSGESARPCWPRLVLRSFQSSHPSRYGSLRACYSAGPNAESVCRPKTDRPSGQSSVNCSAEPFAALGQQMALPQTATLSLGGPLAVPETDGGRAWHEAFGTDGSTLPVLSPPTLGYAACQVTEAQFRRGLLGVARGHHGYQTKLQIA